MAVSIGTAYVTIKPSFRGGLREITRQLSGIDAGKAGEAAGGSFASGIGKAVSKNASRIGEEGGDSFSKAFGNAKVPALKLPSLAESAASKGLAAGKALGAKVSEGASAAMSALGTVAKAGALAAGAAGAAAFAKAFQAGSDYEQLQGGVAKLYGNAGMSVRDYAKAQGKSVDAVSAAWKRNDQAQQIVIRNAKNAYETAGMSANEYLDTATQFSASLVSSLGGDTVKAAKQTQVAMAAMSDNVNTFGSDQQSVTDAFKGFSKQNYTMLDNLKLGYGGTKEEMERLIKDANAWGKENGAASDLSIDSFSDVVTAIQQIQEKQQIAGTTAREAATTVEGSMNMVKSAWDNLLTAAASDDAGEWTEQAVRDLVQSLGAAIPNVAALGGRIVKGLATAVASGLPEVGAAIRDKLPGAVAGAFDGIRDELAKSVGSMPDGALKNVASSLQQFIDGVAGSFDMEGVGSAFDGLGDSVGRLADDMGDAAAAAGPMADGLGRIVGSGASGFLQGVASALSGIVDWIRQVAEAVGSGDGIKAAGDALQNLGVVLQPLGEGLSSLSSGFDGAGGSANAVADAINAVLNVFAAVVNVVSTVIWGVEQVAGAFSKVAGAASGVPDAVSSALSGVGSAVAGKFSGIPGAVSGAFSRAVNAVSGVPGRIAGFFSGISQRVGSAFSGVRSAIAGPFESAWRAVSGIASKIAGAFSGIHLEIPHFDLPHLKITGGEAPYGWLGHGSMPQFGVDWYAKGGAFDQPTIAGIGDGPGGTEYALKNKHLDSIAARMSKRLDKSGGGPSVYVNGARVNDDPQIQRVMGQMLITLKRKGAM